MELVVNAQILCTDGHFGHVVGVVVYPAAKRVTHVIAEEKGFVKTEYLVPVALIAAGTQKELYLSRTRQEAAAMKPFVESEYLLGGAGYWSSEFGEWPGSYAALPGTLTGPDGIYEDIPPGELEIHRYARIEARDGNVGRVDGFAIEPSSGRITHLIMREGHLWGRREVTIPAAAISRIKDEAILLDLNKAAISDISSAGPDIG